MPPIRAAEPRRHRRPAPRPDSKAAPHVDIAKKAAGQEHLALFTSICTPPPPVQPQQQGRQGGAAQQGSSPAPPRAEWYAEPVKVFDNLYATVIPLRDGNNRHVAVVWGGTGFNWRSGSPRYIQPATPATYWYDNYARSARKMRDVASKVGADVVLSNHPQYDNSTSKLSLMTKRRAGQPHPYVVGNAAVDRFLTVTEECAKAGPRW